MCDEISALTQRVSELGTTLAQKDELLSTTEHEVKVRVVPILLYLPEKNFDTECFFVF